MDEAQHTLAIYLHLARASELRRRWLTRDKLLLISALHARRLGLADLAEHCRERLLAHNPGHLLGHFPSVAAAGDQEGVCLLVQQAERVFSREKAEHMLATLGVELGHSEATYDSAEDYLTSILGPPPRIELSVREDVTEPHTRIASTSTGLTDEELTRRQHFELRALWTGIVGLTLGIAAWSVLLWWR